MQIQEHLRQYSNVLWTLFCIQPNFISEPKVPQVPWDRRGSTGMLTGSNHHSRKHQCWKIPNYQPLHPISQPSNLIHKQRWKKEENKEQLIERWVLKWRLEGWNERGERSFQDWGTLKRRGLLAQDYGCLASETIMRFLHGSSSSCFPFNFT